MLHDLEESRRTNVSVSSHFKQTLPTAASSSPPSTATPLSSANSYVPDGILSDFTIISDNYWPQLSQLEDPPNMDSFVIHPVAAQLLDEYQKSYTELKKPRKINVFQHYGQVLLELAFDNGLSKMFSVSPLQVRLYIYLYNCLILLLLLLLFISLSLCSCCSFLISIGCGWIIFCLIICRHHSFCMWVIAVSFRQQSSAN
jgi:hypothetical protein